MSKGSVGRALPRAKLTWDDARDLADEERERRLYPSTQPEQPSARVPVDFTHVHRELRRKLYHSPKMTHLCSSKMTHPRAG
jgi:hypothetical protein